MVDQKSKIKVTIQNSIRKTAVSQLPFAHVVTSPYKSCYMSLRMQALDRHIAWICMALNSYILFTVLLHLRPTGFLRNVLFHSVVIP